MRAAAFLAGAGFLGISLAGPSDEPLKKIRAYKSWHCVTPQAVDMVASTALLCAGPQEWDRDPHNPHFKTLFRVYVNRTGRKAMETGKGVFPVGSTIVKEKFQPKTRDENAWWTPQRLPKDAKPILLTAMIKREKGYDAKNGDWQYLVLRGDASEETTKGLEHCGGCHQSVKSQGFVFRSYISRMSR